VAASAIGKLLKDGSVDGLTDALGQVVSQLIDGLNKM